MKKITVLFCACIILSGCSSKAKVDIQAEADAIRNMEDQWTVALQKRDAGAIMSFFANDAVSMSSAKPTAVGPEAIRNLIESGFADTTLLFNTYTGTVDAVEVSAAGDLAYARGHDEITTKTKDGLVKVEGRWIDIWKKSDGQWKVVVGISNSDKPLGGQ